MSIAHAVFFFDWNVLGNAHQEVVSQIFLSLKTSLLRVKNLNAELIAANRTFLVLICTSRDKRPALQNCRRHGGDKNRGELLDES